MFAIPKYYSLVALLLVGSCSARGGTIKVHSVDEFKQAAARLQPGDTLVFANGNWTNADLLLNNKGTQRKPIVFIAETPGKVIFTGQSRIRISGEYLELNGIAFLNGAAPKGSAIEFRENSSRFASHCRVTNCVIDNYNNPNRLESDHWVALYGKHNRFDHNYIANKKNLGTTLIVELNDTANQENHHRIDHNYFGIRPRLGSNGGETIRIGTSTFSKTSSRTIVEENYFEHCNGEVEIISVKSCDNILRRNTFFECEGALVLRHGDRNIIENNFFTGNGKPYTGGVRVINAGHTIRNNFFHQLAGDGFRSALTIMNGVPNSPINRYEPVRDVTIAGNVFVDCGNLEFCGGKDLERTTKPEGVLFAENIFCSKNGTALTVNDDISGITFQQNIANFKNTALPAKGWVQSTVTCVPAGSGWKVQYGVARSSSLQSAGKQEKLFEPYAGKNNTGVTWYQPGKTMAAAGKLLKAVPGENTLYDVVMTAGAYDIVELQAGKEYLLSKTITIKAPLIIRGGSGAERPLVRFAGEKGGISFFSIENGGSLRLSGIRFNGLSDNGIADSFIRTGDRPMTEHYNLFVDKCDFLNLTDSRKHALKVYPASFADTIQFTNCFFNDITGDVISIAAEKEDKGIYNAEYVIIRNCVFSKILLGAVDVYRGGNDESTTGPYFIMDHCTFSNVGNVELGYVVRIKGVQYSNISNCLFSNAGRSGRTVQYEDYGWTVNSIDYCNMYEAGRIESFYNNMAGSNMWKLQPKFVNIEKNDLWLQENSPLKGKGSDGKDIGAVWKNGQLDCQ